MPPRIRDAFVGVVPVAKIYLGDHLVWQRRPAHTPLTVPFTIPFTLLEVDDAD